MSAPTTARDFDAYLSWQADMGGDEVILEAPLVPRAARPPVPAQAAPAATGRDPAPPPSRAPAQADPEFFTAIAEKLAKDSRPSRKPKPVIESREPAAALPEFAQADAYWAWLDAEYPRTFGVSHPPFRGLGHPEPRLAVVEFSATAEGIFTGASGALLDRMMQAIGLSRDAMYLTALMKTPPPGKTWARKDAARMLPALLAELRLLRCGTVLLLGEACAQAVLRTGRGLEELAGTAHAVPGTDALSFAATWHPDELLADESRKKPAWAHLKWLQARLPR